ncbi:hypothetical protein [Streptomyces virginiae]|uniref:hypothetical protein n=1 Tax=Streptomyces virginiae TaxID=1961 RepID=UPI00343FA453
MHPDDEHRRTWTLRFPALLAADAPYQRAWPGERRLTDQTAVEEAEFACRNVEGPPASEVFAPGHPRTLQATGPGHRVGELDAAAG